MATKRCEHTTNTASLSRGVGVNVPEKSLRASDLPHSQLLRPHQRTARHGYHGPRNRSRQAYTVAGKTSPRSHQGHRAASWYIALLTPHKFHTCIITKQEVKNTSATIGSCNRKETKPAVASHTHFANTIAESEATAASAQAPRVTVGTTIDLRLAEACNSTTGSWYSAFVKTCAQS